MRLLFLITVLLWTDLTLLQETNVKESEQTDQPVEVESDNDNVENDSETVDGDGENGVNTVDEGQMVDDQVDDNGGNETNDVDTNGEQAYNREDVANGGNAADGGAAANGGVEDNVAKDNGSDTKRECGCDESDCVGEADSGKICSEGGFNMRVLALIIALSLGAVKCLYEFIQYNRKPRR